jgi:FHA domain
LTTEVTLFILRVASAALLLGILGTMFWVIWRDFRQVSETTMPRRSYGRVVRVQSIDGHFVVLPESYPLLPLTSLGRTPTNTITIEDTFASGDHAMVALRNGRWWLEDRQSTNGTLLNGVPINQSVIVTDGDIISIGQTHYRLELEK